MEKNKTSEVIISLIGRLAFPEEKIKEIVCKKKQDPVAYLEGYNACDGNHNVAEIAKIIEVTSGTLSPILQSWEKIGIIYIAKTTERETYYKCLYRLKEDLTLKRKKKEIPKIVDSNIDNEVKLDGGLE